MHASDFPKFSDVYLKFEVYFCISHRLIKTQIGHARVFTWYRGQRQSPARAKTFAVTRQIRHTFACVSCYCATFRLHLFTRAGDGRWPRYQAKSLACLGCGISTVICCNAFWEDLIIISAWGPFIYNIRNMDRHNDKVRYFAISSRKQVRAV